MDRVFIDNEFPDKKLHCENCGWSGRGMDTHIIDFYGVSSRQQIECPRCKNYLGDLKTENRRNRSGRDDPFNIS